MKHIQILMDGKLIDSGISELIQNLWNNNIDTIQCCEGGYILSEKTRFTHENDEKNIENAHIIFYKKDLNKIKKFLPIDADYIIGDKRKKGHLSEWLGGFNGVWVNFKHK